MLTVILCMLVTAGCDCFVKHHTYLVILVITLPTCNTEFAGRNEFNCTTCTHLFVGYRTSCDAQPVTLLAQGGGSNRGARNIPIPLLKESVLIPTGNLKDIILSWYMPAAVSLC